MSEIMDELWEMKHYHQNKADREVASKAYDLIKSQQSELEDAISRAEAPIPMILCCPECGEQHIDRVKPDQGWDNPPHRTHQCDFCGHHWRPSDRATTGVARTTTLGKTADEGGAIFKTTKILKAQLSEANSRAADVTQDWKDWHLKLSNALECKFLSRGVTLETATKLKAQLSAYEVALAGIPDSYAEEVKRRVSNLTEDS